VAVGLMAPNPIIPWLVWIAIFHIYLASPGLGTEITVSHPSIAEWDLGFLLSSYSAIWSAIAYVIVVILLCRKIREKSAAYRSLRG
jgi:hypothetical protein